jgi:phospholipase D
MKKILVFLMIVLIFVSGCGNLRSDSKVDVYFCPEDNCKEHVLNVLENANNSILFMTYSFTDNDIGNVLVKKYKQGLKVKGIFEKSQDSKYSEYYKLKDNRIDVRFDKNKYYMHNKIFIIDEEIVITGSYNPTRNGDENNNENLVIIYDKNIAKKYVDEFNKLF